MRDGCVSCEHTGENSIVTPWIEMADYASAAGKRWMYITYLGVAEFPATGENTTIACGAYVEDVTHLGTKGKKDEK